MKKPRLKLIVCLLLSTATGWAATHVLYPGDDIQVAVNAATDGDTLLLSAGTYSPDKEIIVLKTLIIRGEGSANTIVDGGKQHRCFFLANDSVLSGITIANGYASLNSRVPYGGGGVCCSDSTAVVSNCVFRGNATSNLGGGMLRGTANNCLFMGNSSYGGGGMFQGIANNCTFVDNSSSESGGGIDSGRANNCIVWYNRARYGDDNLHNTTPYNTCSPGGTDGENGNITARPLFVSPSEGNLRLTPNSPCIDAGGNAYAPDSPDMDGNPRVLNGTVDMGAYESLLGDSDEDGLSDSDEIHTYKTDPFSTDTDGDAIADGAEVSNGLDPLSSNAGMDSDDDGLLDSDEVNVYGTNPLNPDTDEDGTSDGDEVANGTNPLDEFFLVDFLSGYGISEGHPNSDWATGTDPLLPSPGDAALVQLIYAGENGVPDGSPSSATSVHGDDVLLYSHVFFFDGQNYEWDAWAFGSYGRARYPFMGNGKVYGRIFDTTNGVEGSWYYEGHVQIMSPHVSKSNPDSYNLGQGALAFASNQVVDLYHLAVSVNGSGTVSVAEGDYSNGVNLAVSATADPDWLFVEWSGGLEGGYSTASTNLLMYGNRSITSTFSLDADNDGMSNREEEIAGTIPTNKASRFILTQASNPSKVGGFVVNWSPSLAGRIYSIRWAPSPTNTFQTVEPSIKYPQNSWTDTVHGVESGGFYRVDVRQE